MALCAGCYDFEETIVLAPDLSGSITILVTIYQDENDPGTSREEFASQRDEIVGQMKEQAGQQIPEGVRLAQLDLEWLDEHRSVFRMEIEFDHIRKLQDIKPAEAAEGEDPPTEPAVPDFEIVEKEDRWVIRHRLGEKGAGQDLVPKEAYEGRTFVFSMRSQAKVLSHNGEAIGPEVRWQKKMTEIVTTNADIWAEWEIAKE